MKNRYFPAALMALFTVCVISAAYISTEKNISYDSFEPIPALSGDVEQEQITPRKTIKKTVTLSENGDMKELCSVSGQTELAVTFSSTRGPLKVWVGVYNGSTVVDSMQMDLQDTLTLSIDAKKTYTVKACIDKFSDYGDSGGKVTFQIAYT